MTFETITLTFRQKVLLDLAIENEIANLRGDAKDLGLLTKELGDEYEDLLKLITACRSFRVEPPPSTRGVRRQGTDHPQRQYLTNGGVQK